MGKLKKNIRNSIIILGAIFVALEILLRIVPCFLTEPLKSHIADTQRYMLHYSRVCSKLNENWTTKRILLPRKGKKDILVLGDSFPFGANVRYKDSFPWLIQEYTNKKIANLGIGDTNPIDYNRMLEVGMRYDPDIILYCIFANDFIYRVEEDRKIKRLSIDNAYQGFDQDKELFVEKLTFNHRLASLKKRITGMSVTYHRLSLLYAICKAGKDKDNETIADKLHVIKIYGNVFLCPNKSYWDKFISWNNEQTREGFSLNINLLKEANAFARKNHKKLVVILLPFKEMVYGPLVKEGDLIYDESHERTFVEFEKEMDNQKIAVLNPVDYLRGEAKKGKKLYFTIDGHFNETGHKEIAEVIIHYLLELD
jgi:hypothetical protein